jgi:group I intron endonuclease
MFNEKTSVIYKITSPNGKIYVGQTVNFSDRIKKYKYNGFKVQKKLWNNCQKYNWSPIDNIEIIETCLIDELNDREIYWINYFDSYKNGLNLDLGGNGKFGYKHSDETKEKLRLANLGKKHTEEAKAKISVWNKNRPQEISDRIGQSHLGKKHTEETKAKIRETKKNNPYKMTPEQRLKISVSNLGSKRNLGKKHTDETKNKISNSKKGVSNSLIKIKIICITTGVVYDSQTDAAKILNLKQTSISRVCTKVRKTYKGLVFMFYDEYLKTINND